MAKARRDVTLILTCEHARAAVPPELGDLGLPQDVLRSHRGFDAGALPVARVLAGALGARLHEGRWSRLVADLNRDADNPKVIARRVDGRWVPGNRGLDAAGRAARLDRYWRGYRAAVERDVAAAVGRGTCVHVSVHSFVERLRGVERTNDVGLLFDPTRSRERALVDRLLAGLVAEGLRVRRNFPYFGSTNGFTTQLRGVHPAARYLGIELELNQRRSRTVAGQRRFAAALVAVLGAVLEERGLRA